jgi:osmotically-inducible protein OsmY
MRSRYLLVLVPAILALAGCNARQKAEVDRTTERVTTQTQHAVHDTKQALSDSGITLKVKTAMGTSDKLNTKGINVDTKDKVVHLKGTVADAGQKALAERIAKDTVGPDVKVSNELEVHPATKTASK